VSIDLISFTDDHASLWDSWCVDACNSTFLHQRKFLSYHGKRFQDASVLIFESSRLIGVIPAARALHDSTLVVSHPGATYGGIVHNGWLSGERMVKAFEQLKAHYRGCGYTRLLYKPLPHGYARGPSQDDLYALFRLDAPRVRCELSCAIDLNIRRTPSERRRRGLKKALKAVTLVNGSELLTGLWRVLTANLEQKHSASPVHSLAELALLVERFPKHIQVRCATVDGSVEAGVILFNSANVWHAQYIASSEMGYAVCALDAVFESAINDAGLVGARYFDFGTSNEQMGLVLNEGLYRFKAEFGGGGMAHEFYELELQQ
jgi:Acetyltransferase (GNAT) domain